MIIMSVDLGDARTGLAVCDSSELLASPLTVINEKRKAALYDKIAEYAAQSGAEMIVVGLPVNMDGSKGFRALESERSAEKIRAVSGLPTEMWDERCTTVSAISALNRTNTRGKKRKSIVDAVAAVMILEDYLKYRKNCQFPNPEVTDNNTKNPIIK